MRGLQRVVSAKCKGKNGMPRGAGFWGGRPARKKPSGFGVREGSTSERVRHFSEAAAFGVSGRRGRSRAGSASERIRRFSEAAIFGVGGRRDAHRFFLFGRKKAEKREKT